MAPDELSEIDAKTAALMGWRPVTVHYPDYEPPFENYVDADGVGRMRVDDWHPTTDPAANKMLLSKLRESHTVKIWIGRDQVRVSIFHGANGMGVDPELEMAVCKAALAMAEATGAKGATTNG